MPVRLYDVHRLAGTQPVLAADRERQLDRLGGHLLDAGFERGALTGPRCVGPDRFVLR